MANRLGVKLLQGLVSRLEVISLLMAVDLCCEAPDNTYACLLRRALILRGRLYWSRFPAREAVSSPRQSRLLTLDALPSRSRIFKCFMREGIAQFYKALQSAEYSEPM